MNKTNDTRPASYLWWSRMVAIALTFALVVLWLAGYGPFRANCCGAETTAAVPAAKTAPLPASTATINLAFMDGKIILSGALESDAEKAKLLASAAAAYGANNVIDKLTVQAGISALASVNLTGQVPTDAQKSTDGDTASKLFAPAKVNNQLSVAAIAVDSACTTALKAPVGFASGSSQLSSDGKKALDAMAGCLKNGGEVLGHTDNVGNPQSNLALSLLRAKAASAYLASKGAPQLTAKGAGDTSPVADNASPESRAKNRRMEISAK